MPRHLRPACLLLLPLAAQCVSVTVGAGQYATSSLAYLVPGGCFQVSLAADSAVSGGVLFANINTATQLTKAGLVAPAPAEELSPGAVANFSNAISGPGAASLYLTANTAFAQPPEIVNSRWSTGVACQMDGVNVTSCYGYFNDDLSSADDTNIVLTLIYATTAGEVVQVSVDAWPCGDGAKQTGGIAPWQNALPIGQQFMPAEEECYNIYYAQLGAADVPVSPDKDTCAACGKLGVCPVRASLYNAFYLGFQPPDSLVVRASACPQTCARPVSFDTDSSWQSFGRTAVWQDCLPSGDGSAPLTYNLPLTYVDGVYRFLDANGNLAEVQIEWCRLQINADGLKLAIILPVGLAAVLAVGSAYFQWAAKRAEKRRLAVVEEEKRMLATQRELEYEGMGRNWDQPVAVPLASA